MADRFSNLGPCATNVAKNRLGSGPKADVGCWKPNVGCLVATETPPEGSRHELLLAVPHLDERQTHLMNRVDERGLVRTETTVQLVDDRGCCVDSK